MTEQVEAETIRATDQGDPPLICQANGGLTGRTQGNEHRSSNDDRFEYQLRADPSCCDEGGRVDLEVVQQDAAG